MTIHNIRYRRNLLGQLVVQVQIRQMQMVGPFVEPALVWRDARIEDLPTIGRVTNTHACARERQQEHA